MKRFTVGKRAFIGIDGVPALYDTVAVKKPFTETYLCGQEPNPGADSTTITWVKLSTVPPGNYKIIGRANKLDLRGMHELMGLGWSFIHPDNQDNAIRALCDEWVEFTTRHEIHPQTVILEILTT